MKFIRRWPDFESDASANSAIFPWLFNIFTLFLLCGSVILVLAKLLKNNRKKKILDSL